MFGLHKVCLLSVLILLFNAEFTLCGCAFVYITLVEVWSLRIGVGE